MTTHRVNAEDDYYTAVDDLKSRDEPDDAGAGFVGVKTGIRLRGLLSRVPRPRGDEPISRTGTGPR